MSFIYKSFKFSPAGILPGDDTILGFIRDKNHVTRTVAITLTSALEGQKHKSKITGLRNALVQQAAPDIRSWNEKFLDHFKAAAKSGPSHITAKVDAPEYIPQTVEMVVNDTQQSHIILDCRNKESFYSMCRYLEIDDATLFALAELQQFKPEVKRITQVKPAGEAHRLVTNLQRKPNLQFIADEIIKAHKYLLPDVDLHQDILAANFERTVSSFEDQRRRLERASVLRKKIVSYSTRLELWFQKHAGVSDQRAQNARDAMANHPLFKIIKPEVSSNGLSNRRATYYRDPDEYEAALRRYWEKEMGMPMEAIQFPTPITYMDYSNPTNPQRALRFREGIYNLPFENCYFELVCKDESGHASTVGILANTTGKDQVRFWPFIRPHSQNDYLIGRHYFLDFSDRQNPVWRVVDGLTKQEFPQEQILDYDIMSASIISALNSVTKINEPGYEDKLVIPTGGQVLKSFNRHSGYFEYHVIDEYPEIYRAQAVRMKGEKITNEQRMGGVIRHMVRGYPRPYTHADGSMDLIIVAPYARGDASKGFKMKSYDYRKS